MRMALTFTVALTLLACLAGTATSESRKTVYCQESCDNCEKFHVPRYSRKQWFGCDATCRAKDYKSGSRCIPPNRCVCSTSDNLKCQTFTIFLAAAFVPLVKFLYQ